MAEERTNKGDVDSASLPPATCTDLTVRVDPAELIYSFFSPGKVGQAFHESAWTPEMCVETLVDLARNCPDQKIRMEAIKYLDEKAKQSMMLSGRMEEVSRTLTKRLPDGSTAELTATSVSRLTTSAKVLESLATHAPNEVIEITIEETPDERTRTTGESGTRIPGDGTPGCGRSEPEPTAGRILEQSPGPRSGVQPSGNSPGPPTDHQRNRESNRPVDSPSPGGGGGLDPTGGHNESEADMGPASTGNSLFDITAPAVNPHADPAPLQNTEARLPEEDRAESIDDDSIRGHHPPTIDTGTGLAAAN